MLPNPPKRTTSGSASLVRTVPSIAGYRRHWSCWSADKYRWAPRDMQSWYPRYASPQLPWFIDNHCKFLPPTSSILLVWRNYDSRVEWRGKKPVKASVVTRNSSRRQLASSPSSFRTISLQYLMGSKGFPVQAIANISPSSLKKQTKNYIEHLESREEETYFLSKPSQDIDMPCEYHPELQCWLLSL